METFFGRLVNLPIPKYLYEIPQEVLAIVTNFKAFFTEINLGVESGLEREANVFDEILFASEIDDRSAKMLYVFSKFVLTNYGRENTEMKIREIYNYKEEHTPKMLRYLQFLELAYSGQVDFSQ